MMRKLQKPIFTFLALAFLSAGVWAQSVKEAHDGVLYKIEKAPSTVKSQKSDPMVIGPTLYSQMGEVSDYFALSTAYSDDQLASFTGNTADDFVVPEGSSWNIKYVRFTFYTPMSVGDIDHFKVVVYNNNNGKPGTILKELSEQSNFHYEYRAENANMFDVTVGLTEAINLPTAGTYWISAIPVTTITTLSDYGQPTFWAGKMLQKSETRINNQAHTQNPGGGFFPLTSWADMSTYWVTMQGVDIKLYNLNFALFGIEKNYDLALTEIREPVSGDELTNSENIKVYIQNHGLNPVAAGNYQLHYRVNGGTWSDLENGPAVGSGEETNYSFHAKADLSVQGEYTIEVELVYAADENLTDNTILQKVNNYGVLYPSQPNAKVVYTTCEGTFTDQGGLDNVYTSYSSDTVVFFPGEPGNRIRLEFYNCEIDGTYAFRFYNGSNTYAPHLGNWEDINGSQGIFPMEMEGLVVEGTNPEGALTVIIPGFDIDYSNSNFLAKITCVPNQDVDFKVTDVQVGKPYSWAKETVSLSAGLLNRGSIERDQMVTFFANGQQIGSVSSTVMKFNQSGKATIDWTPETAGEYTIKAQIPEDEGLYANEKELSIEHTIYPQGALVEGFEGEMFPPEGWISKIPGGSNRNPIWYNSRPEWEGKWQLGIGQDTLITPKLSINANDTLQFIYSAGFFGGVCNILYAPTLDGPWKTAHTVSYGMPFATNYKATLKRAAGNNYLAFDIQGGSMDFIRGANLYIPTADLVAASLKGNIDPQLGIANTYEFKIRSMGSDTVDASEYSVKLWKEVNGVVTLIDSLGGKTITLANNQKFLFTHTFSQLEKGKVYATISFDADKELNNNKSNTLNLSVIDNDINQIYVGNVNSTSNSNTILGGYYACYSENIYLKEQLNTKGELSGIVVYYNGAFNYNLDFSLYAGETDLAEYDESLLSTSNLFKVYDGTFEVAFTNNEFMPYQITFEKPFLYSGDKNLVLAFYAKTSNYDPINAIPLMITETDKDLHRNHQFQYYELTTNIADSMSLNALGGYNGASQANVKFYFTPTTASLSGIVTDEADGSKIAGSLMSLANFVNTTVTNNAGYYSFPAIPTGNIDVTSVKFGYYDQTKTAVLTESTETQTDFAMKALTKTHVKGIVVANDSLKPVAGVTVNIAGYSLDFTATTNNDGYFEFTEVYGDKDYVVTLTHPKYYPIVDSITLPVEGIDLGIIVLDEIEQNAFNVIAATNTNGNVDLSWQAPFTGIEALVDPTMGIEHYYYWYNEPDENVQLGNLFRVSNPGTVTSIDISTYGWPGAVSGELYLRFYNKDRVEFMKPVSFMIPDTSSEWLNIPVPNFSYNDEFYVMIHWNRVHEQTAALNQSITSDNVAWMIDKNNNWTLLTDQVGLSYSGAFSIRANVIEAGNNATKALTGYDVWRNSVANYLAGNTWTKLNNEPVSGSGNQINYTDQSFDALSDGYYIYAVSTNYTLATSNLTYSNVVDKGMYKAVNIEVTANNSANIDGAKVTFTHANGAAINNYTGTVTDGNLSLDRVLKGDYNLTITKGAAYYPFSDDFTIANDTTLKAELREYIFTPAMLNVSVDQDNKQALFTWGLGNQKTYTVDDGSYEQALSLTSGSDAEIGNYFNVDEAGQIYSVDILGVFDSGNNPNNEMGQVVLVAYDYNMNIIGESEPFVITTEDYFNVPLDFVEFNGPFYLMVKWIAGETLATHALAMDTDSYPGVAFYNDAENGLIQLADWGYYGNFLISANVLVNGKKAALNPSSNHINSQPGNAPKTLMNIAAAGQAKVSTENTYTFSIYLDDLTTPVATNITDRSFMFNEQSHLLVEGEHTYKAGVKAVYVTGESLVITQSFVYNRLVGIAEEMDKALQIFPNPANDAIVITGIDHATIQVYNSLGKQIRTIDSYTNATMLNVADMTNGVYIIKIDTGYGVLTRNLIINR